jgi:hypothetical protein
MNSHRGYREMDASAAGADNGDPPTAKDEHMAGTPKDKSSMGEAEGLQVENAAVEQENATGQDGEAAVTVEDAPVSAEQPAPGGPASGLQEWGRALY